MRFAKVLLKNRSVVLRALIENLETRQLLSAALTPAGGVGGISTVVLYDANGDGSISGTETGIAGQTVYLDTNNNGQFDTGEFSGNSNSTGNVVFSNLPVGTYHVRVIPSTGLYQILPANFASNDVSFTAGQNALAFFGVRSGAKATGKVFYDFDQNGSFTNGVEGGLQYWTVYDDLNANGQFDTGEPNTLTDTDGNYVLNGLPPETIRLKTVDQTGWVHTSPPSGYLFQSTPGATVSSLNFGLYPAVSSQTGNVIADVYVDRNLDKVYQSSIDKPLGGETVFLDVNSNGTLDSGEPFAVSDSKGIAEIYGVQPGSFTFAYVPDAAGRYVSTSNPPGSSLTLVFPKAGQTISAGDLMMHDTLSTASVSGTAFVDNNTNNIFDTGDTAVVSTSVFLDTNNNGVLDSGETSTLTNSLGQYSLAVYGLAQYHVRLQVPDGYAITLPSGGDGSISWNPSALETSTIGQNFAIRASLGTVTGSVLSDTNGSGTSSIFSKGIPNQVVYEDLNNNGQFDIGEPSTTTTATGSYTLKISAPGYMRSVAPLHSETTGTPVLVQPAGTTTVNLFQFALMSFSGFAFDDANANGVRDVSESPLAGVRAYVDQNFNYQYDAGEPNSVSGADGLIYIPDISSKDGLAGEAVKIIPPAGRISQATSFGVPTIAGSVTSSQLGQISQSFVSGHIVQLLSNNGVIGIAGITAYADLNNDGVLDAGDISQQSDGLGLFQFGGLPTGAVTIRVDVPAGFTAVNGVDSATFTNGSLDRNFFAFTLTTSLDTGSIAGTTYIDADQNGKLSPWEIPAVGRTIYLDSNNNNQFDTGEPTTVSDSAGRYVFSRLPGANYSVGQILPPGFVQTFPSATINRPVNIGGGQYADRALQCDFGSVPVLNGNISGTVFNDKNGNGVKDVGDSGVSQRTIYLDLNSNGLLDDAEPNTLTDSSGFYTFTNLPITTYQVRLVTDVNSYVSSPASGSYSVKPPSGQTATNTDFALVNYATLSGTEYEDFIGDGTVSSTVAGLQVYIDTNANGVLDAAEPVALTNSAGSYTFTSLKPGTYTLRQSLFAGWTQSIPVNNASRLVTITSGQTLSGLNFAQTPPKIGNITGTVAGSIAGETLYLDANNNSALDTGEYSTTTAANGNFTFSSIPIGSYTLRQIVPTGYTQVTPANGAGIAVTVPNQGTLSGQNFIDSPITTGGPTQLTGTVIGTAGSYNNSGNTIAKAVDGNLSTFFDGPAANGNWVGLDLGTASIITSIKYSSRANFASRMNGGIFQGSNVADFSTATDLYAIPAGANPSSSTLSRQPISNTTAYRYVRYLSPASSYGDISEIQFFTGDTNTGGGGGGTTPTKLAGTGLGTPGSYNNSGNNFAKALDGNLSTYFDAPTANGNWVGLDLGTATVITQVAYASRSGWASRMNGGIFQGSNSADFSNAVALFTIPAGANASSSTLTTQAVTNATAFRYVRYLSPANSYGDIAEAQFFSGGTGGTTTGPTKLIGTTIGTAGSYNNSGNTTAKAFDGSTSTYFDGPTATGNWVGLDLGSAKTITQIQYAPRGGFTTRMDGGIFQASNTADFSAGVINLYTIASAPTAGVLTAQSITTPGSFRYVRYLSPAGSYGDIAELAFFGN